VSVADGSGVGLGSDGDGVGSLAVGVGVGVGVGAALLGGADCEGVVLGETVGVGAALNALPPNTGSGKSWVGSPCRNDVMYAVQTRAG
jgi:hypothetical protein